MHYSTLNLVCQGVFRIFLKIIFQSRKTRAYARVYDIFRLLQGNELSPLTVEVAHKRRRGSCPVPAVCRQRHGKTFASRLVSLLSSALKKAAYFRYAALFFLILFRSSSRCKDNPGQCLWTRSYRQACDTAAR